MQWVKWLGVILDESLTFEKHWQPRIQKARGLLGAYNGIATPSGGYQPVAGGNSTLA